MRLMNRKTWAIGLLASSVTAGSAFGADLSRITYSTYLGGGDQDEAIAVVVNNAGEAILTGNTLSTDFPVLGGSGNFDLYAPYGFNLWDSFLTRFGPDGGLRYSSYHGDGLHDDFAEDLTLKLDSDVVAAGWWDNLGMETEVWIGPGYFVPFGERLDQAYGVGSDAAGHVYVAGVTCSFWFPFQETVLENTCDTFIMKWSPDKQLQRVTFLGGDGSTARVRDIAVDAAGNVWLTGNASSGDFPLVSPLLGPTGEQGDAFVARLDPAGNLAFSTFLGGSALDEGWNISLDAQGNAWVTGTTSSNDFPVLGAVQGPTGGTDAFLVQLSPAGDLLFSTYLGGSGDDSGQAVAVLLDGSVAVAGYTRSIDLPLREPIQDSCAAPCHDAFITLFDPRAGELRFSTYLGGQGQDQANGIAADSMGNLIVVGRTSSPDFPTNNAFQTFLKGGSDAFVTKINVNRAPSCAAAIGSPALIWPPNHRLSPIAISGLSDPDGDPITLTVTAIRQDEAVGGEADGAGVGTSQAWVRAERDGSGDGRVYHLSFEARDPLGATCAGEVTVCVPHNRSRSTCDDGGALFGSTGRL